MARLISFFILTLVASVSAEREEIDTTDDELEQILSRVRLSSRVQFSTATAGYIIRLTNETSESIIAAKVAQAREGLEHDKMIRITNDKAFGREPDIESLNATLERNLADFKSKLNTSGVRTFAAKYSVEGAKYRVEQVELPNDVALEDLRLQVVNAGEKFNNAYIRTWDGKQMYELVRATGQGATEQQGFTTISYTNIGKPPDFMEWARVPEGFLAKTQERGEPPLSFNEIQTDDGQLAIRITIGRLESAGNVYEVVVLPAKSYVISESVIKSAGVIKARAKYSNFSKTSSGAWVPGAVLEQDFSLDEDLAPRLKSSREMLLFQDVHVDVSLADDCFDLTQMESFNALPMETVLLPEKSPYITPADKNRAPKAPTELSVEGPSTLPSTRTVLLVLNAVFILIVFFRMRMRNPKREQGS